MLRVEQVWREILYQTLEAGKYRMTQLGLAAKLDISLSTVNHAIKPLRAMGAVDVKPRLLEVRDPKKILYHWASNHNPQKDLIYATRVDAPVKEIEASMPNDIVYGGYTAYKLRYGDTPADYSEVYVYSERTLGDRFPLNNKQPNLFVLKQTNPDYGRTTTIAQTFTDLWNMREWYAKEYVKALEAKIDGILERPGD